MIQGVLFDFFGTLVAYSPSRRTQGYEKTYDLLKVQQISVSYNGFLDHWGAAAEELDRWSAAQQREYAMLDGFVQLEGHLGDRTCMVVPPDMNDEVYQHKTSQAKPGHPPQRCNRLRAMDAPVVGASSASTSSRSTHFTL